MAGTEMLPAAVVAGNSDKNAAFLNKTSSDSSSSQIAAERKIGAVQDEVLPAQAPKESAIPDLEAVTEAIQSISDRVEHMARKLEFSVNDSSGKVVVTVFDRSSEEVIRQIPGEQAIAIAEHIASLTEDAPILGLLLDSQA